MIKKKTQARSAAVFSPSPAKSARIAIKKKNAG